MKDVDDSGHLAVLIDAENVPSKIITGLLGEVAKYGTASVRRIYGDWTSPQMKSWRECLLEHSIVPIQQFAYTSGKNASDGAMIIDAMDLMYTGRFASFCLVSSDSDFTRLAARIREQGISVYGFGNRHNTHKSFIAACTEFVYLDAMSVQAEDKDGMMAPAPQTTGLSAHSDSTATEPGKWVIDSDAQSPEPKLPNNYPVHAPPFRPQLATRIEPKPRPLDPAALRGLTTAIQMSNLYDDDYVHLGQVGHNLLKLSPDLNARNYGYPRFRDFVEASGIVELKMKPMDSGIPVALVRLKGPSWEATVGRAQTAEPRIF